MKKLLAFLLAAAMLATLCACGNKADDSDKNDTQLTTTPVGEVEGGQSTQIIYAPDDEGNLTSQVIILTTAPTEPTVPVEGETTAPIEGETTAPTTTEQTAAPSQSEAPSATVTEGTVVTESTPTEATTAPTTAATDAPVTTTTTGTTAIEEQPPHTTTDTEAPTTTTTTEWEIDWDNDNLFNDAELQW